MAKPKKGSTMANQPCNKCQQPTQQLMAASSPFYTCNNPECAFYLPVESDPKEAAPMADVELQPLPPLHIAPSVEPVDYPNVAQALMDYARACVEANLAPLQAENERLRAEVAEWRRVAAAQAELHGEAEARAERLAEALRWAERHCPCGARPESPDTHPHLPGCPVGAALGQEDRNG